MDSRVVVAISALENHLHESLKVVDLSPSVNLSSSRLRHLFKTEMKQSLMQYRKNARMAHARVLLETTYLSVKEIMHQVGINSDSHFSRDFKEACGLSPTQYRARTRKSSRS